MTEYSYRAGRIRKLKEGIDINQYYLDHPDAVRICKPPGVATLERWESNGYCKALDGCKVEPDGYCPHNLPSWLMVMELI